MKEFFTKQIYGNSLLDWSLCISSIIGAFVISKIIYLISCRYFKNLTAKTRTKLDDILVDMIEEPFVILLFLLGTKYSFSFVVLPPEIKKFIYSSIHVLMTLVVGWGFLRTFNAIFDEYLTPLVKSTETTLDDQILVITKKGVNLIIICLTILLAISNAGYNIGALLAGLGIGGLAFALAAQDTVSNFFGGITLIADKPFKINDRVQLDGFDGVVKDIGLRSTKLQTVGDNHIVTIPNSKFSSSAIRNISAEPSKTIELNLGLTYDTTPEQIDLAMKLIGDIIRQNQNVLDDYIVSFNAFNDFALNIFVRYYIIKDRDYFKVQTEINREILSQFNKHKLEFAFPTQTILYKQI